MVTRQDFNSPVPPTWCKGCGNYGILNAVKMALAEQDIAPHQVIIFSGIGCLSPADAGGFNLRNELYSYARVEMGFWLSFCCRYYDYVGFVAFSLF